MAFWDVILKNTSDIAQGRFDTFKYTSWGYVTFLLVLVLLYMSHNNCVERDYRRISELSKEIKELRYEDITTSAELMNMSKQSEVLRRVTDEGLQLKELTEPPRIIVK
ncbi:MAG: hypothetical protein MJZ15_01825 [Bacteroidales bacterium]|nr:hypothetical protein [Bacteroidales bacterium]